MYWTKDFIETEEGLVFAVVENGIEQGRVLSFLRYVQEQGQGWKKYSSSQAWVLMRSSYPEYIYYSTLKDVELHAVPEERIYVHHQPKKRLQTLLTKASDDPIVQSLIELCSLFKRSGLNLDAVGVTGSLLINAQNQHSDIDLVFYDRDHFFFCRDIIQKLIASNQLQGLDYTDWISSYRRRQCELTLDDYIWHEKRKCNKAIINGIKFDLSLVNENLQDKSIKFHKCGRIKVRAQVIDAYHAYDYPAVIKINHPLAGECVSYTATYTGQAITGEHVEIAGLLEQSEQNSHRIVVGSSREAEGEYIRVVNRDRD